MQYYPSCVILCFPKLISGEIKSSVKVVNKEVKKVSLNTAFESIVEQAAIKWFRDIGYEYLHGTEIPIGDRGSYSEVIVKDRLYNALTRINPTLPTSCIEDAIRQLKNPPIPEYRT